MNLTCSINWMLKVLRQHSRIIMVHHCSTMVANPSTKRVNHHPFKMHIDRRMSHAVMSHLMSQRMPKGILIMVSRFAVKNMGCKENTYTLPETKIAPENGPSQKETSIPTINFQILC